MGVDTTNEDTTNKDNSLGLDVFPCYTKWNLVTLNKRLLAVNWKNKSITGEGLNRKKIIVPCLDKKPEKKTKNTWIIQKTFLLTHHEPEKNWKHEHLNNSEHFS